MIKDRHKSDAPSETSRSLRRCILAGFAGCCLLLFGFGGWATTSKLAGAVIATGSVIVETNLKKVQHPTGGIVGELNVRDGDSVDIGDIVIRLDATVTRANLAVVTKSLDELAVRRIRLEAERDGQPSLAVPDELSSRAAREAELARLLSGENRLFEARKAVRLGQTRQLRERVVQLNQEIAGLDAQKKSMEQQIKLIANELIGVADLYEKKLVPITRISSLQREASRLEGELGQFIASLAQVAGKIVETELQIIQIDQDLTAEVNKELREIEAKSGELLERKVAAEDQLKRIDIRAPQNGIVHQLAVHTVGGVVAPGDVLMLIVPKADRLIVEAKVAPQDIDQIALSQAAIVRFSAFNQQTTPELIGKVSHVAADLSTDPQTQQSWYTVRVELTDEEVARLEQQQLVPGMPTEIFIQTVSRTPFSYLIKPLQDQIAKAMRED